ncbi:unnamed protein product [Fusarium venenatum]|uniref:Mid2 domain-containing protein n=1 Tax=Fusarium venenatum TaxID=56646 RepID=A0A2L2SX72_9HYPO|nr:uncharacterized protein FVRRES_13306 [Fusarium venenatum]KAH6979855.1 hypothetical protein EDB82DRAFT_478553 [Fusarium venenatum]CEI40854.1 unnamed protein product [Fusarium venenatum]
MHFSKFILAALPALALAQETTTQTSTAVVTKTYYLSTVRTVTATGESTTAVETSAEIISTAVVEEKTTFLPIAHNTTIPASTPKATGSAGTTGGSSEPSQVPENAGAAVIVGKFAMVGVAGAIAAALLMTLVACFTFDESKDSAFTEA